MTTTRKLGIQCIRIYFPKDGKVKGNLTIKSSKSIVRLEEPHQYDLYMLSNFEKKNKKTFHY